jgi:signal transduction histidine kinase
MASTDEMSDMIDISVDDTGVGMTPAQMSQLFSNFTKFMADRNMNKEGVGLGLNIARNIARALGGDITVRSQLGEGSRFTLKLPKKYSASEWKGSKQSHKIVHVEKKFKFDT